MKIAYFGIPVHALSLLEKGYNICLVVLTGFEEEHTWKIIEQCSEQGIAVKSPKWIRKKNSASTLKEYYKPDLILSMNFSRKIPKRLLKTAPLGGINIHPSLLPRLRGANPYFWCIANGEKETGVSAHFMTSKFDSGDIILQQSLRLDAEETMGTLIPKIQNLMAQVSQETLTLLDKHGLRVPCRLQPKEGVSEAPKVAMEHLQIKWKQKQRHQILRHIRAANYPNFGAFNFLNNHHFTIWKAKAATIPAGYENNLNLEPGKMVVCDSQLFIIALDGVIQILEGDIDFTGKRNSAQLVNISCVFSGALCQ